MSEQQIVKRETPSSSREELLHKLLGPRNGKKLIVLEDVFSSSISEEKSAEQKLVEQKPTYLRLEHVGKGGFGEVWKAQSPEGKVVALKYFLEDAPYSWDNIIALDHPNITKILDHGKDEKGTYVVREFVDGGSLRDILQTLKRAKGKLTEEAITSIAQQVCAGLEYIHSKGLTHADVKPENILIPSDWETFSVKLTDGCLDLPVNEESLRQSLTTRAFQGTLMYVAPEVIHGDAPTPASDVYSLGKVLVEMITGITPRYTGDERIAWEKLQGLEHCLENNPKNRPPLSSIQKRLKTLFSTETPVLIEPVKEQPRGKIICEVSPRHVARTAIEKAVEHAGYALGDFSGNLPGARGFAHENWGWFDEDNDRRYKNCSITGGACSLIETKRSHSRISNDEVYSIIARIAFHREQLQTDAQRHWKAFVYGKQYFATVKRIIDDALKNVPFSPDVTLTLMFDAPILFTYSTPG